MSGIGHHTTNIQVLHLAIDAAERDALAPTGLTVAQFKALEAVDHTPGISSAELARRLGVTPQSSQIVISNLIAKQLVTRAPATSGRSLPVRLTTAGGKALAAGRERVASVDAAFSSAFSDRQAATLARLLAVGTAAVSKNKDGGRL